MASVKNLSNKAKIARRVIEVLEFFDDDHRQATVMDIVRRYGRPQSSTSELLASLVDMGLLTKDNCARTYQLTPRAALLGTASQTGSVRDGRLIQLIDRLSAQTGLSVALFGMVGLQTQIINWRKGSRGTPTYKCELIGGALEPLCDSAAGHLLLSTIAQPRRDGVLRRLNAEAADTKKFSSVELGQTILKACETGQMSGPAGFGSTAKMDAVLLPDCDSQQPLAIALVYESNGAVASDVLLNCINDAISQIQTPHCDQGASVELLTSAARVSAA